MTTTTVPATTTTKPTVPESDKTRAASLVLADLGGTWTKYEGPQASERAAAGCPSKAFELRDGTKARTESDIYQRGSQVAFVRTTTREFADAAAAKAYADAFVADDQVECARKAFSEQFTEPELAVEVDGLERRTGSGTFRGQYSIWVHEKTADGRSIVVAREAHIAYAKGPLAVHVMLEQQPGEGETAETFTQVYREALDAAEKVLARAR